MDKTLYIVHCIDTEGPLYESLDAKFQRLHEILGMTGIKATRENFEKICRGHLDLNGKEALARRIFTSHLCGYLDTWDKVDEMVARVTTDRFRSELPDSFGGGYVYSWFCVDHVDYVVNPRQRAMGYHAIFDHYRDVLDRRENRKDGLHWHFHPMSIYREAHRCATSLLNSPHVFETLARRIIERGWFPSCVRSGFQTERPDIHWFLEQYFPFDFTNTSVEDASELDTQADMAHGRFGDWRRAPADWSVYHPSHDHYQLPGNCRRWIARALNLMNRFSNISAHEVEKAFARAAEGKPALLAVASHDFRDVGAEVVMFRDLLRSAAIKFGNVKFKYCEAREAIRHVTIHDFGIPLKLSLNVHRDGGGKRGVLTVETLQGKVFGPQPFLAVKTRSQRFIHDNLDMSMDMRSWRYVFDAESILPDDVDQVGVAANDSQGNTCVEVVSF